MLQYLILVNINIEEWRVKEGAMPSLCHLRIDNCWGLKAIPDGLRFVTTLRELEINFMPKSFKDKLDPIFTKSNMCLPLYLQIAGNDNHH